MEQGPGVVSFVDRMELSTPMKRAVFYFQIKILGLWHNFAAYLKGWAKMA